jgi:hypothetical protein
MQEGNIPCLKYYKEEKLAELKSGSCILYHAKCMILFITFIAIKMKSWIYDCLSRC